MKSKKPRPTFNRYAQPKHRSAPLLWIAITLIVVLIILAYLFWSQSTADDVDSEGTTIVISTVEEQGKMAQSASIIPVADASDIDIDNNDSTDNLDDTATSTLDNKDSISIQTVDIPNPKTIIEAPLPATDSLAKEEIDRLNDEKQRFAEQERLAAEQIAMTKQLTQMKAEQIALLEAQIAQLEAQKRRKAIIE